MKKGVNYGVVSVVNPKFVELSYRSAAPMRGGALRAFVFLRVLRGLVPFVA